MTAASAVLPAPRASIETTAAEPETEEVDEEEPDVAGWLRVTMFTVAIIICLGVAGIGGWRSYSAVSQYFGSWTVPVIADGLVVGTTAIRLAALTRGWRVPGSALLTIGALGGTVWLNIHASQGKPIDQFSHAIAPVAYLLLMEMLAYVLKLQLKLKVQAKARLSLLGWIVSPVVSTRTWLLMQRTGQQDVVAARVLIQQSIRARSQLVIICPSPWYKPLDSARRARSAALQTVRDGLLTAAEVVELLPVGRQRVAAVELLMEVNRRSLKLPATAAAAPLQDPEPVLDPEPEPDPEPEGGLPPELELPEPQPAPEPESIPELAERVEQDQSKGRRRRPDAAPRETKKSRFTARLLEVLAADLAATGTSRLLSNVAEERNAAMYEIAKEIELDKGAARTYFAEAADAIEETARQVRPGGQLFMLRQLPAEPESDGVQDDAEHGGEAAAG